MLFVAKPPFGFALHTTNWNKSNIQLNQCASFFPQCHPFWRCWIAELTTTNTFGIYDNVTSVPSQKCCGNEEHRTHSSVIQSVSHSGSNSRPTKSAILGSAAARKSPFSEGSMFGVAPLFTWGAKADGFKMASRWWQRLDCSRGGFCVPPTPAVQLLWL